MFTVLTLLCVQGDESISESHSTPEVVSSSLSLQNETALSRERDGQHRHHVSCEVQTFCDDIKLISASSPEFVCVCETDGDSRTSSPVFHLPAEFFHPTTAAIPQGSPASGPAQVGSRHASPASWASLRSPGANSRITSTQVPHRLTRLAQEREYPL